MIFFSKKLYLVDFLNGFTDVHNHILPGLDDGAKTVEESLEIIGEFLEIGVSRFICTPHIMNNYYDNTPKKIKHSFKTLKETLLQNAKFNSVDLKYAAEYLIDDNFENLLIKDKALPLNDNHILIEMSYLQASINLQESIKKIKEKGYFPVLAHPERYQYLARENNKYRNLKENEIRFQLNMLSLSDYYGQGIRKTAMKIMDDGQYDFIASDVHNLRHLSKLKDIVVSRKLLYKIEPLICTTIETFY